jgi:hypothetical protein
MKGIPQNFDYVLRFETRGGKHSVTVKKLNRGRHLAIVQLPATYAIDFLVIEQLQRATQVAMCDLRPHDSLGP